MKESVDSRRIRVINYRVQELHNDVTNMYESLVDREKIQSLDCIEQMRNKLNLLKDEILNGDIV